MGTLASPFLLSEICQETTRPSFPGKEEGRQAPSPCSGKEERKNSPLTERQSGQCLVCDKVCQKEMEELYPVGIESHGTHISKSLTRLVHSGLEEERWKLQGDGEVQLAVIISRNGEDGAGAESLEAYLGCSMHRS